MSFGRIQRMGQKDVKDGTYNHLRGQPHLRSFTAGLIFYHTYVGAAGRLYGARTISQQRTVHRPCLVCRQHLIGLHSATSGRISGT